MSGRNFIAAVTFISLLGSPNASPAQVALSPFSPFWNALPDKWEPKAISLTEYQAAVASRHAARNPTGESRASLNDHAATVFGMLDKNGDERVSFSEVNIYRRNQLVDELGGGMLLRDRSCVLPQPSKEAEIILLGTYETDSLSSALVAPETGAGIVTVDEGDRPLYVVLVSHRPTIWQFSGAVDRVERVIVHASSGINGDAPAGGVTGIERKRFAALPRFDCLETFSEAPSWNSVKSEYRLKAMLGRLPDKVSGDYTVSGFSLPTGSILRAKDRGSWSSFREQVAMFNPGGVTPIAIETVVTNRVVSHADLLPGLAGLRQLVEKGALTPLPGLLKFRVNRALSLPAGLAGAHATTFVVPDGIPSPEGDIGHSCFISEDGGKVLAGECR